MSKILLVIFLLLIFYTFLLPGSRVATDFHYSSPEQLKSLFDFPYLWSTRWGGGLGYYVSPLWAWPFEVLFGLLGKLGLSFGFIERLLGIFLTIVLGYFGINKLLNSLKVSDVGKLVGTAFFLSNSYFILLIDGGQLNLAIAYSIIPLAFFYYINFINRTTLKHLTWFTVSVSGISIVDLRIVFILGLLIFLKMLFDVIFIQKLKSKWVLIKNHLLLGLFSGAFLFLINLFWILPILFSRTTSFLPASLLASAQIGSLSFANIGNGIFFQQPHWFKNNFGEIANINADFLLLPLLILLSPVLAKRDFRVGFWLMIVAIFVFLSKGINEPLGGINSWFFEKIPGFILFRDPTKFFFLIALGYTVLISISIDEISKILKPKSGYFKFLLPILLLGYFLYLNKPVLLMQMNGLFSAPIFEKEYQVLNKEIDKKIEFGRIVWINIKPPLGFESPNHPAVDAFGLVDRRPFAVGIKGAYEKLNFLREATFSGQLLDVLGVASIIYPNLDYRKDLSNDQRQYFVTFSNQLKEVPYVEKAESDSKMLKLNLKQHQNRFFLTEKFWWIIGSDKIYEESTKSAQLNLAKNAMVFAEESVGLGEKISTLPLARILLISKTPLDFTASFLNKDEMIFPAENLKKDPDNSGWWKRDASDLIEWRDFLVTKYGINNQDFDFGGGWSIAEGDLKLKVIDKKILKDKILLARVLESTRSGEVSFYQQSHLIGQINTLKGGNNIRWFEIAKLKNNGEVTIETQGDINVLNSLAVVDEKRWSDLKILSQQLLSKQQTLNFGNEKSVDLKPLITYKKINPTKFEVEVKGLNSPRLLVFSEAYSPLWELNGQKALSVFSMLNGFVIDRDGEYLIEFSPQKYVYLGLVISLTAFLILLILLFKNRND